MNEKQTETVTELIYSHVKWLKSLYMYGKTFDEFNKKEAKRLAHTIKNIIENDNTK